MHARLLIALGRRWLALGFLITALVPNSYAALFEDDEARKAILDLRARVDQNRQASESQLAEANRLLQEARRGAIELQNQIEMLRAEIARLRGQGEQTSKDLSEMQRRHKDLVQNLEERLRRFEPAKVQLDGQEFIAEPAEQREYDSAFALFRKSDFSASALAFAEFLRRFPQSGYRASALFWRGNAQFALKDYKEAIAQFRALIALSPTHAKAPEAALGLANSQIELKDMRAARKTLEDLIKVYPQSEAAVAAKERLRTLR